jgi:hypothetical protein
MVGLLRKIQRGQRGQALVETAIAVPLLLLLVLGIVDFGKAYNYSNDLTHLANEAARYATVNTCIPDGSGGCKPLEGVVKNDAETGELANGGGSIESPGVTISICLPDGPGGPRIKAVATARYKFLFTLNNFTKRITTSSTMYREVDPAASTPPSTPNYTVVDPCPS